MLPHFTLDKLTTCVNILVKRGRLLPGLNLTRETIVKVYQDMVSVCDRLIGEHTFKRGSGISRRYWQGRYWPCWSAFQAAAGFKPNARSTRIPDEVLLQRYAEFAVELKRLPTTIDVIVRRRADSSFPNNTVLLRLGSREDKLPRLAAFCEGKPEFEFVLELIRRHREKKEQARRLPPSRSVRGIVYLVRQASGYKIRRIDASGGQHSLESYSPAQRPDTVHAIDTDDPAGIEFYWRRRFRLRRQGRNCFSLTDQDLNAFKSRRFQ